MKVNAQKIDEIATNIARKYSRNTTIPYEDMYQDLWVKALEIDTDNIGILITSLKNYAIDLSRKNWRQSNSESCNSSYGTDEYLEIYLFNSSKQTSKNTEEYADYLDLRDKIDRLNERERTFIIAKAYLNGGIEEFATDFKRIYDRVPEDRKQMLHNYNKSNYTDDIIVKVFLGVKTGTNCGSICAMRHNIKTALLSK